MGGMGEIFLYENFDCLVFVLIVIVYGMGYFDLYVEGQLFDWVIGDQMYVVVYGLQEIFGLLEGQVFVVGKKVQIYQFDGVVDVVDVFCDLVQCLQVVQFVFVFFDVGFQYIVLVVLVVVMFGVFGQFCFDEFWY